MREKEREIERKRERERLGKREGKRVQGPCELGEKGGEGEVRQIGR